MKALDNKYVISTRVRVGRSFGDIPLNSKMTEGDYKELEQRVIKVTGKFTGTMEGKYHSYGKIDPPYKEELIVDKHFLFKENDPYLEAAGATNYWPIGRGIFINDDEEKKFLIWCGEEDHLRIISMQQGGDLAEVAKRLRDSLEKFSSNFKFAWSKELGFLTFCPTNLGTTMRASVHIELKNLSEDQITKIANQNNLQVRGIHGEHSASSSNIWDLSNKRRLGLNELQALREMHAGVKAIIDAEKERESSQSCSEL